MNFTFEKGNPTLTREIKLAGCGLRESDLTGVTVWQREDFKFGMHTGYHGRDGNHYIYVYVGDAPAGDTPRVFVDGKKAGQYEGGSAGGMKTKHITDAKNVVSNNKALFLKIVKNLTS